MNGYVKRRLAGLRAGLSGPKTVVEPTKAAEEEQKCLEELPKDGKQRVVVVGKCRTGTPGPEEGMPRPTARGIARERRCGAGGGRLLQRVADGGVTAACDVTTRVTAVMYDTCSGSRTTAVHSGAQPAPASSGVASGHRRSQACRVAAGT